MSDLVLRKKNAKSKQINLKLTQYRRKNIGNQTNGCLDFHVKFGAAGSSSFSFQEGLLLILPVCEIVCAFDIIVLVIICDLGDQ